MPTGPVFTPLGARRPCLATSLAPTGHFRWIFRNGPCFKHRAAYARELWADPTEAPRRQEFRTTRSSTMQSAHGAARSMDMLLFAFLRTGFFSTPPGRPLHLIDGLATRWTSQGGKLASKHNVCKRLHLADSRIRLLRFRQSCASSLCRGSRRGIGKRQHQGPRKDWRCECAFSSILFMAPGRWRRRRESATRVQYVTLSGHVLASIIGLATHFWCAWARGFGHRRFRRSSLSSALHAACALFDRALAPPPPSRTWLGGVAWRNKSCAGCSFLIEATKSRPAISPPDHHHRLSRPILRNLNQVSPILAKFPFGPLPSD